MQTIEALINSLNSILWGPATPLILLAVGLYLTVGLRFIPWRYIVPAARILLKKREAGAASGEIPPARALATSLSATVGSGNIAGVTVAILIGGPGAIFWMWISALFGMATKYAEAVLAVHYRETDRHGNYVGGPMYYIKNGFSKHWHWLGTAFAIFGTIASFGIGNMVQSNSVTDSFKEILQSSGIASWLINDWVIGILIAIPIGFTIIGGIKRIAGFAAKIVPLMIVAYLGSALIYITSNIENVLPALSMIVQSAFTGTAATGGFVGATVWAAIRFGVARGVFSNEAGLGSAAIVHAAAQTSNPVRQGLIAMLGTFIDTIIICTITALIIIMTGAWTLDHSDMGIGVVNHAFNSIYAGGDYVVLAALIVFSFTSILGWSYYSERCFCYLFNGKYVRMFRILWVSAIIAGAGIKLNLIWLLADAMNALMALPNLIALVVLSPVVFRLTREYLPKL